MTAFKVGVERVKKERNYVFFAKNLQKKQECTEKTGVSHRL